MDKRKVLPAEWEHINPGLKEGRLQLAKSVPL